MNIILVGLNHKTAPVEVRERFAFIESRIGEELARLLDSPLIPEGVILSTCNRVEICAVAENITEGYDYLSRFLYEAQPAGHSLLFEDFVRHLYFYASSDAIGHLFRVSSSLDSMVVGEPQILGQIKSAYDLSLIHNSTGLILNKLFKKAISVAKRVRSQTRIAENAVSVSYAAVGLARKIFGDLTGKTVLLVGAGEMAELAARHLSSNGVKNILVTNRSFTKAVEMAREFGGSAVQFEDLPSELAEADIVICSTGAPYYIIQAGMVSDAVARRKNKPVFLVDISVPRNIDPKANQLENVFLYDIDDLQSVVEANLKERQKEAEKAEQIIAQEVDIMERWLKSLNVVPIIIAIREKVESIRKAEMEKAVSRWGRPLQEDEIKNIEFLTQNIINKILHYPLTALKEEAFLSTGDQVIQATRRLFDLQEGTQAEPSGRRAGDAEEAIPEDPVESASDLPDRKESR